MAVEIPAKEIGKTVLIGVFLKSKNLINFYRQRVNPDPDLTLFFFYLNDVDFNKPEVRGTCFDYRRGCWIKKLFPLPDVLYLRDGASEQDNKRFEHFLAIIRSCGVKLVNSLPEFDKWDLYRDLISDKDLARHLPETRLYRKEGRDLERMLGQYGRVYLKACRGRQGRQVVQLIRLPGGQFESQHFSGRLFIRKGSMDGRLFRGAINKIFGDNPFIIQQPIDLLSYEGRKVDLRAEMQRNRRGDLEVVAIPVRVARKSSPVTTHASSYRLEQFFCEMLGYSNEDFLKLKIKIFDFIVRVYHRVEELYGPFGEIGIDIGLDGSGKLWLIECNAKPAKVSLCKAYSNDSDILEKAYANPLSYALYIAQRPGHLNSKEAREL